MTEETIIEAAPGRQRKSVRPLARLFPYIGRYRGLVAGAVVALVVAACTTLTLPMAVRRMIDHGFSESDAGFIDTYFAMLFVLAIVLALASALRYFFVITLGERIVSDLRRDVFDHVTKLSPAFFDENQSGEIVSRLTADTTQIKSAVGATASVALRNTILCLGAIAMMVVPSVRSLGRRRWIAPSRIASRSSATERMSSRPPRSAMASRRYTSITIPVSVAMPKQAM